MQDYELTTFTNLVASREELDALGSFVTPTFLAIPVGDGAVQRGVGMAPGTLDGDWAG